jgi:cation transport ATPase
MKLYKYLFLIVLIAVMALPAMAQVEKVAIRTTGISCGTCAAVSELYLKRLPSIDKVAISMKNEAVMVSYKAGSTFQPKDLRDVLKKTEVGVTQFQVSARGRVQDQAGKKYFIAGKDKFVLISGSNSVQIPLNTPVSIEAVVNDRVDPMELRVMTFKPVENQDK